MEGSEITAMATSDETGSIAAAIATFIGMSGLLGWLHARLNRIEKEAQVRDDELRRDATVLEREVNQRFERVIERLGNVATRADLDAAERKIMDAIRDMRGDGRGHARSHDGD
jgi:hypothetical protein